MKRKIYWRRGIIKTISILFIVSFFILTIGVLVDPANANKEEQIIEVVVAKNDTLWAIAKKHGNNQMDIRKFIYEIKELNQIDATIYPGQVLYIPLP